MSEFLAAPGAGDPSPEQGGMNARRLLAIGTAAGVALLAVLGFVLASTGGNGHTVGSILEANQAAVSPSATVGASGVIPGTYAGAGVHDPFKPIYTPTAPAAGAGGSAAANPTTVAGPTPTSTPTPSPTVIVLPTIVPTLTPTATPTPTPTATVTVTPSPTGLPTSSTPQTLTLVSVDTAADTVTVNVTANGTTTPFTAHNGAVFDTYFKVVSILSDSTTTPVTYGADFQYGDQFVQLSTGQSAQLG
jgi:hypothetical protein